MYIKLTVPEKQKYNIFFVRFPDSVFIGIRNKTSAKSRYSVIENDMLKGKLLKKYTENKTNIFIVHIPSVKNWAKDIFYRKDFIDIFFPFPPLDHDGNEFICPDEYWDKMAFRPEELDVQEKHFRHYTKQILKKYVFKNCKIYDPACSTGEFLFSIKEKFPFCEYFASDRSELMINLAKTKIPNSFVYDISKNRTQSTYDIILCRFINHEVIKAKAADQILKKLINLLTQKGKIIIFGHTPVVLDIPEFAKKDHLNLLQTVGYCHKPEGFFQYYILEKNCR